MLSRRLVVASAAALCTGAAIGQEAFPQKAVRIVVPFPPGGSFDVIARQLAVKLGEAWKQPVVIDNRAGAGGNIGAQAVIAAPPDGYTLLFWGDGVLANPLLYPRPPFDAVKDLAGVALVATAPQVIVASDKSGVASLQDVLQSRRPLHYGTAGNGSPGHLAAELLKREGAAQLVHVPYRGGGPALTDLLGGQIQLVSTGLPACIGMIRSGRLKPLAVTSRSRTAILPNVPAVSEAIRGFELDTWFGFMAPKATPPRLLNQVSADLRGILAAPEIRKSLTEGGFLPAISTPGELDAKMARDLAFWRAQVAKSGAKAE